MITMPQSPITQSSITQSSITQSSIQRQVRLPLSVALEVVLQGIRIRLGRSLVTLMGVVLGIAFLMSILTGQAIRRGVSREIDTRAELQRMLSFLTAEIGPVRNRALGVIQVGPANRLETRFLRLLVAEGAQRIRLAGRLPEEDLPSEVRQRLEAVDLAAVGADAGGLIVLGDGQAPADVDWPALVSGARQRVVAMTRAAHNVRAGEGIAIVDLDRVPRPEEIAEREAEERRTRFRTGWIIIISLLVTVIGISNAMLMSVTERFREIGTMKCLGALSAFVRQMFFIESGILGIVGSLAGALFGGVFSIAAFATTYGLELVLAPLNPLTMLGYVGLCLVSGVTLSIVAAIYPAAFASRMVPATALRSTI